MTSHACVTCGKALESRRQTRKFCSDQCKQAHHRRKRGIDPLPDARKCVICGQVFRPKAAHAKTCSAECCRKWRMETKRRVRALRRLTNPTGDAGPSILYALTRPATRITST